MGEGLLEESYASQGNVLYCGSFILLTFQKKGLIFCFLSLPNMKGFTSEKQIIISLLLLDLQSERKQSPGLLRCLSRSLLAYHWVPKHEVRLLEVTV